MSSALRGALRRSIHSSFSPGVSEKAFLVFFRISAGVLDWISCRSLGRNAPCLLGEVRAVVQGGEWCWAEL